MATQKRFILIDDDVTFGHLMKSAAAANGVSLEYYESLLDLGYIGKLADFDGAIVDFDLGEMNGAEIGRYLDAFLSEMPMVLVSSTERGDWSRRGQGTATRRFVHKQEGCQAILACALREVS